MFKIEGLDELSNQLEKLSQNAKELDGEHQVSLSELFDKNFMSKYTNFLTFDELLEAGNFIVNCQEDFESIPEDELDEHIKLVTKFSSWEEMQGDAAEIWIEKELFK